MKSILIAILALIVSGTTFAAGIIKPYIRTMTEECPKLTGTIIPIDPNA